MKNFIKNVDKLIDQIEQLTAYKIEIIKLSLKIRVSMFIGSLFLLFSLFVIFSVSYVLIFLGAAVSLSKWIDNTIIGFLMISLINLIIGIMVWKNRNKYIIHPIANFILRQNAAKENKKNK